MTYIDQVGAVNDDRRPGCAPAIIVEWRPPLWRRSCPSPLGRCVRCAPRGTGRSRRRRDALLANRRWTVAFGVAVHNNTTEARRGDALGQWMRAKAVS